MTRRQWLLPLLPVLALAEIAAFLLVGQLIGFAVTVLALALVSVVGLLLLRREGLRAWRGFREAAVAGSPPGRQVTDGLVGLGGALLLAAPGLLTGVAGAALLLPPVRALARGRVQAGVERRMPAGAAGEMFGPRRVRVYRDPDPTEQTDDVVEGEIVDDR